MIKWCLAEHLSFIINFIYNRLYLLYIKWNKLKYYDGKIANLKVE